MMMLMVDDGGGDNGDDGDNKGDGCDGEMRLKTNQEWITSPQNLKFDFRL